MTCCYILLPVHNRREITHNFIKCLNLQTYSNYRLILIDDGSTDGTAQMAQSQIEDLTIITGTGNWWWAGGLQQGINWLKANSPNDEDAVLMINNDVTIKPDFLEIGIKLLQAMPNTLLQAQAYSSDEIDVCLDCGLNIDLNTLTFDQASSAAEINCLCTRGLFMRWQDLQRVGDFYPQILPHYLSDYEFTIRAYRKGLSLKTHPDLKLWLNEKTTGFHPKKGDFPIATIWKRYFSRRSSANKIDWTMFVLLTSPKRSLLANLGRVWLRGLINLFAQKSL
ncbi:glycosyltransferase family 2 protein [Pseudanabaena yagii]|uniref:Glycosyltransferase family 2 protein n=1 Tax=Pseudanabaena yagii GIHE-NHR1 TaxID=2722753 RepID=A0ABX1LSX8_9CYAN|nr:glycosyltransferase [Pseudanabaena yagii]NMF58615.1 glycosyltransferase family 2 protein [Pseudanabaena yagii GIHE-NHR1]